MEKIVKISFCGNDICVVTDSGNEYRKALEFFPTLKEATPAQREQYQINKFGDAVRWTEIDEDIHISSLTDGVQPTENAIGEAFRKFPILNVSELARSLGMHKSLLSKYIYGTKKPSEKREKEILDVENLLFLGRAK